MQEGSIITRKTANVKVSREHKDRLFRLIFGREENKKNLLELYNGLNNTQYENLEDLEITTIDDVIYMGMKNDVSLLIHSRMALYEHQSTYNPNMPIRGMIYSAKLYSKYIEQHDLNIYGEKLLKLPTPQYVVFYNGMDEHEDEEILKLSDAFDTQEKPEGYEWTARMLNINYGRNQKLMEKCRPLREYAIFSDKVRKYMCQCNSIEEAVNHAVEDCIAQGVMAEFLKSHRGEVLDVCITEYNEEKVMDAIWEEGHQEGMLQGREEGIRNTLKTVLEFASDIEAAVEKTAESYHIDKEKVWEIWEQMQEEDK